MKKTYYILHGLVSSEHNNWFPWLKNKLEQRGDKVIIPKLSRSINPSLDGWVNTLRREIVENGEGTIIAHSLGGILAIKYIEAGGLPLKVILVGAPFGLVENVPEINSFFERPIDIRDDIKKQIKFCVLYSDNDLIAPAGHAKNWGKLLGVKPILIPNKEHFLQSQFPEILNYI